MGITQLGAPHAIQWWRCGASGIARYPSGRAAEGDYSSAPTLNPALLDPTAPGPTLDHGLVERIEPDPQLVNALNQNEELANALEHSSRSLAAMVLFSASTEALE
jgi:hypothetical protein